MTSHLQVGAQVFYGFSAKEGVIVVVLAFGDVGFDVNVMSDSMLSAFTFDQPTKTLSINVTGTPETSGFCAVTFPITLLGGPYVCQLNGTLITPEDYSNATHTALVFTYTHSSHTLEIIGTTVIPEFPALLGPALLLAVLTLALLAAQTHSAPRRP